MASAAPQAVIVAVTFRLPSHGARLPSRAHRHPTPSTFASPRAHPPPRLPLGRIPGRPTSLASKKDGGKIINNSALGLMAWRKPAFGAEDIAQLQAICARGRIDVIAALQRTNGNMEAAANWLLSHD